MEQRTERDFLPLIQQKRQQLEKFISAAAPRKRRLINMTIVGGTLAATLTGVPAVGGQSVTAWLTSALGLSSPSWQILCAAAAASSIMATVSTQLLKSQNIEEHVSRAQGCRAKLEVLEVGLIAGHIAEAEAAREYLKCVEEVAFIQGA